jgi:hypothetical protein
MRTPPFSGLLRFSICRAYRFLAISCVSHYHEKHVSAVGKNRKDVVIVSRTEMGGNETEVPQRAKRAKSRYNSSRNDALAHSRGTSHRDQRMSSSRERGS